MIHLRSIEKTYQVGTTLVRALRNIDLDIRRGEFVSIMGKSGSGKSTLLNIIGCLDAPSSGRYDLAGSDVSSMSDHELSAVRSRRIGFIFQNFNLIRRSTAQVNVEKPLVYQGLRRAERQQCSFKMLDKVGLVGRADHFPTQLSGGQQQRVAIARALVTNPDILIADEPTGNLDTATGNDILSLLRALNAEGRTILLVTHDPGLARHAHRTIVIEDGLVMA